MVDQLKGLIGWFVGAFALLAAVSLLVSSPVLAPAFFIVAALSLPPVTSRIGVQSFSITKRLIFSLVAIMVSVGVNDNIEKRENESIIQKQLAAKQEEVEAARKEAEAQSESNFIENKKEILNEMTTLMEAGSYDELSAKLGNYYSVIDEDLEVIRNKFAAIQKEIADKEREIEISRQEAALVKELKKIPASEYLLNKGLYLELTKLRPNNEKYLVKYNHYSELLEKKELRDKKIARQFLPYSGAHIGVMSSIRQSMHDPDSLEHVSTSVTDNGKTLTIFTTIRGNNAFGAKVLERFKAKVSLDGRVISINKL